MARLLSPVLWSCIFFWCANYLVHIAQAQYIQDYQWVQYQGQAYPHWRRTASDSLEPVLIPKNAVVLWYNCYYMKAICQNAQAWLQTPRGQNRLLNNVFRGFNSKAHIFGYDLNADKTSDRGNAMCPGSWKNNHPCPERTQPKIMPDWYSTDKEFLNPLNENEIVAEYNIDMTKPLTDLSRYVLAKRSGRYYTCEEWPPRSFVEGGTGTGAQGVSPEGDGGQGTTICAPMAMMNGCAKGQKLPKDQKVWSEQNWQGTTHSVLQKTLRNHARDEFGLATGDLDKVAMLVTLLFENDANMGPAGYRYGPGQATIWTVGVTPKSGKRDVSNIEHLSAEEKLRFMANITMDDLKAWGGNSFEIHVNGSWSETKAAASSYAASGGEYGFEAINVVGNMSDPSTEMGPSNFDNFTSTTPTDSKAGQYFRSPRLLNILDLGTAYILGNLDSENSATRDNSTISLNETMTGQSNRTILHPRGEQSRRLSWSHANGRHRAFHKTPRSPAPPNKQETNGITAFVPLHKRDGPTQCGPGSPCKDDSCCSADGKCGFKTAHCGAGCQSNCKAKAMCGIDSIDGNTPCALRLCCSYYGWCGTETVHCHDPEPQFGKTPCQEGYGSCKMYAPPSCSGRSASAGRKVGYYQGWNVRERKCDKVSPSQINTKGLTHLFYSFVFFNPTTFQMQPMDPSDASQYREFTALASNTLQTWCAIGGWSFSDPGDNHMAWSNMVSTVTNRAAFIRSLIAFMDTYAFQGADLDWEYPGDAKRGGRKGDADNLVLLVQEMRAAFGSRFGLSLTLAPDYWYLRGFKPKAMEPYVDFMGFMAYDLHGPWDTDVKALGSIVRPHTDITELYNNLKPLWFDGVDPAKINLGIAYYGRTYKLADPSCGTMNQCKFTGPGAAGECTAFEGVLSNRELRAMVNEGGYKPYLNKTAMVKYMTYAGDSWVGFDDSETIAMKEDFANSMCLGGTMIWSIDFDASAGADGGSNGGRPGNLGTDLIWVDSEIWNTDKPTVTCDFPCTVVLPPYTKFTTTTQYPLVTVIQSGFTTTVTRPPMTVSVIWISTMVIGGGSRPTTSARGPATVTAGVTLYTTPVWPSFTIVDSSGRTLTTSAPGPPPPFPSEIASGIGNITFVSGLPPRPTTTPYSTPCPFTSIAALCPPYLQDNYEDGDDGEDEGCKGDDCDTEGGGAGGGGGGCKLGFLCNLCVGVKCIKCLDLKCFSCWGPQCEICSGANCVGCKGPICTTCRGKDCSACSKPKCKTCIGSSCTTPGNICDSLQCPIGGDVNDDPQEEDVQEQETNERCIPINLPGDPDPGSPNDPGSPSSSEGGSGHNQPTLTPGDPDPGSPNDPGSPSSSEGGSGQNQPTPTPIQSPNTSRNKIVCYGSSQAASRGNLVFAAEQFCLQYDGFTFNSHDYNAVELNFGWDEQHKVGLNVLVYMETLANCRWTLNKDECNKQFAQIIDGCNQDTTADKQGGVLVNNCLGWRIDPEVNKDIAPPAPPARPTMQPMSGPETKDGRAC